MSFSEGGDVDNFYILQLSTTIVVCIVVANNIRIIGIFSGFCIDTLISRLHTKNLFFKKVMYHY